MSTAKKILLATTLLAASNSLAYADMNVVTSIKPVHSLVSAVMQGVGEPTLIIDGARSPHNFALQPSQAQMIESADIVFWVGHELEAFLEKPLETIGANAKSIELIDSHGLEKVGVREGGTFEKHQHAHGEDEGHDHEADDDHDNHDGDEDHDDHDEHAHGEFDPHIWLDPVNAKAMVQEIEEVLASADPTNAARYESNAQKTMLRIDALLKDVKTQMQPVKDNGYIVFHDAYQYFEKRFGVSASGSITVSPEIKPGAERVFEIRAKVKELNASCVFSEPQFNPDIVATIIEGTDAKKGIMDPMGASIKNGQDLYFDLIENMAKSLKECLSMAG